MNDRGFSFAGALAVVRNTPGRFELRNDGRVRLASADQNLAIQ